jgi:multidrug efflux pump subunit AcrA (membrane-fusion protein)
MKQTLPRRRITFLAAAVAMLIGTVWLGGRLIGAEEGDWVAVSRGELRLGIEVTGTLRAVDTSILGPPPLREMWEFKIAHMAPEGETVATGTPVLAFDTSDLEQQLLQQQAEADGARKQIEKTEKDLSMQRRHDELRLAEAQARQRKAALKVDRPGEYSSAQELAQARLDLELAVKEIAYLDERLTASGRSAAAALGALHSQRTRAEQRVEEIQNAIEQLTRAAPRDGTVIYVTNWRDEKKKIGDACWRGESVIELPDLTSMKAEGQVDEADAGKLEEGQRVTLRLDAHPDTKYHGRVESIWRTVRRKSWRSRQKIVRLEIELDETDTLRMRPGMRFRGDVETDFVGDALLVPIDSVQMTADGPVVQRKTTLGHATVPVELGRRNRDRVEVLDGLNEGDRVSVTPLGAESRDS